MERLIIALSILSGLEILLWLPPIWKIRNFVAPLLALSIGAVSLAMLPLEVKLWVLIVVILSAYRVINLVKAFKNRIQAIYLYNSSRRTSLWLIGLQTLVLAIAAGLNVHPISLAAFYYLTASIQLIVGVAVLAWTTRNMAGLSPDSRLKKDFTETPTLTVAIPARNETADLEECLTSVLSSSYPKLEVLVVDDCSQNSRTSNIIRSYAHAGVRFIAGNPPPDKWLAKNYAYKQLADEANGDILLFCGVDTRFEPDSLEAIVNLLGSSKKDMICVIPHNRPSSGRNPSLLQLMLQPARYAWELALPRWLIRRPPILSTCWAISRQALHNAGGFAAVSRKIVPESYFARRLAKTQAYTVVKSDETIGVISQKNTLDQKETAIRTRYPQLHRRPELVALTALAEIAALVWPLGIALGALVSHVWLLALLSGAAYLLQGIVYGKVLRLAYGKSTGYGLWVMPIAVLYDVALLNYSMWQYEFGEVIWKGRNVCIPVMQTFENRPPA